MRRWREPPECTRDGERKLPGVIYDWREASAAMAAERPDCTIIIESSVIGPGSFSVIAEIDGAQFKEDGALEPGHIHEGAALMGAWERLKAKLPKPAG